VKPFKLLIIMSKEENEMNDEESNAGAADYHRLAALHFELASKSHLAAADADDEGDAEAAAAAAYAAYGHQLRAVGYAEVAAEEQAMMDIEIVEEDDEDEDSKS
jgi:hypothetical protein